MVNNLREETKKAVKDLFGVEITPNFTRPEEEQGDFATNVAMQLAGKLGKNPREVAEKIVAELKKQGVEASVAGPGFINIRVSDKDLFESANNATNLDKKLKNKTIVAEYSDPNPFKVLHAGHLYTTLVGDAISNILEIGGAKVRRVNFGGDVGLHVGKAMWGIIQNLGSENPEKLAAISKAERPEWVSKRYVEGSTAYANDKSAQAEIMDINKRVYKLHSEHDKTSPFAQIYWTCRQWSYEGFEKLYEDLQVKKFDRYYPESETTPPGVKLVRSGVEKGIFEKSNGAIIYPGEKEGLHNRVFITGEGLPTYEAKDLGLSECKWQDYRFDKSVIITADDIIEYMKVVLSALSHFHPGFAGKTEHLTHGMIKMSGGEKMSSRKGNILLASDILDSAFAANKEVREQEDSDIVLGAVRYSFLKNRIGGDIIYDPNESVNLQGNSGPYLQYALVRAKSILRKAPDFQAGSLEIKELEPLERSLARKISEYPEVFENALDDLSPHHVANYLYELAQTFNRFYEKNRVIDDPRSKLRLNLANQYTGVLEHGLKLLGMPILEKM